MKHQTTLALRAFAVPLLTVTAACSSGLKEISHRSTTRSVQLIAAQPDQTTRMRWSKVLEARKPSLPSTPASGAGQKCPRAIRARSGEAEHALEPRFHRRDDTPGRHRPLAISFPLVQDNGAGVDKRGRHTRSSTVASGQRAGHASSRCLAFVDAEREYYMRNPQQSSLLKFSQRLVSAKGQKDGLYCHNGRSGSQAHGRGIRHEEKQRRALRDGPEERASARLHLSTAKQQKARTPTAANTTIWSDDKMIGGFALIAVPAEYGRSGVMTFIVNHDGVVFSKDLWPGHAPTVARDIQTVRSRSNLACENPLTSRPR